MKRQSVRFGSYQGFQEVREASGYSENRHTHGGKFLSVKHAIKQCLQPLAVVLLRQLPSRVSGFLAKRAYGPQLSANEIAVIARMLRKRRPTSFLIFGLGRDSAIWHGINSGGQTVFLENSDEWIAQCVASNPQLDARKVSYRTRRPEWQSLLENDQLDDFAIDVDVAAKKWDVIFVDAPEGWNDDTPGRMQSIHWARKLLADGGDLLIHDCDREVESQYADHYGREMTFHGQTDKLRHYSDSCSSGVE